MFSPVKGKCKWWRENLKEDDRYDTSVKGPDKRVDCSCFVEGHFWEYRMCELPADCPDCRTCRYYILHC